MIFSSTQTRIVDIKLHLSAKPDYINVGVDITNPRNDKTIKFVGIGKKRSPNNIALCRRILLASTAGELTQSQKYPEIFHFLRFAPWTKKKLGFCHFLNQVSFRILAHYLYIRLLRVELRPAPVPWYLASGWC
jgi:hypothetical protein